jgi:hypothetical protein
MLVGLRTDDAGSGRPSRSQPVPSSTALPAVAGITTDAVSTPELTRRWPPSGSASQPTTGTEDHAGECAHTARRAPMAMASLCGARACTWRPWMPDLDVIRGDGWTRNDGNP